MTNCRKTRCLLVSTCYLNGENRDGVLTVNMFYPKRKRDKIVPQSKRDHRYRNKKKIEYYIIRYVYGFVEVFNSFC